MPKAKSKVLLNLKLKGYRMVLKYYYENCNLKSEMKPERLIHTQPLNLPRTSSLAHWPCAPSCHSNCDLKQFGSYQTISKAEATLESQSCVMSSANCIGASTSQISQILPFYTPSLLLCMFCAAHHTILLLSCLFTILYISQPKLWWSTLSSFSLGWSAPSSSSSTWGTGTESAQSPVPEVKVGDHSSCSVTMAAYA